MEVGRSGRSMMSAAAGAARATGSSATDRKFYSTYVGPAFHHFSHPLARSRSLSLGEGLPDSTGARDGTRAAGVLDRGRRRLFSF